MSQDNNRKIMRAARKVLYWIIPPAILAYIFLKVDIYSFFLSIKNIEIKYFLLGLIFYPLAMNVGAFRWYYLKRRMISSSIPYSFSFNNYWIGASIGFLAPGAIGWDIYRIVAATKQFGKLIKNTFVAVVEKLSSLTVCSMIIIISFPFLDIGSNDIINRIMVFSYVSFFGMVLLIAITGIFSSKFKLITKMANRVQNSLLERLKNSRFNLPEYLDQETGEGQEVQYNLRSIIPGLPVVLSSALTIQLVSSFAIFLFIKAVNFDMPYYIPLFLTPVMFFILLLPISFGSLGIREGSYIFFYGIFGMDQEAALLLSFMTLAGRLLNVVIGAIILQVTSVKKIME